MCGEYGAGFRLARLKGSIKSHHAVRPSSTGGPRVSENALMGWSAVMRHHAKSGGVAAPYAVGFRGKSKSYGAYSTGGLSVDR